MRIIILFVLLLIHLTCFAQSKRHVVYEIDNLVQVVGTTNKIDFIGLLPKHILGAQQVDSLVFSHDPEDIYNKEDNIYAKFTFKEPLADFRVQLKVYMTIYENDLKSNGLRKDSTDLTKYIQSERYIESDDPKVMRVAQTLVGKNKYETLKKTYNYVANNVKYTEYNPDDVGASKGIRLMKGDCSEFADLFVALCRANKIPSRVIEGVVVKANSSFKHNWAEAYLDDRGWVTFDPTTRSFMDLDNEYIQVTNNRVNKELKESHYWNFLYFGAPISIVESVKGSFVH